MPVAAEVCRKENCLGLRVGAISEVATITLADLKVVTITKPISIAVRYGSVSVSAGAKLPFISRGRQDSRSLLRWRGLRYPDVGHRFEVKGQALTDLSLNRGTE
jgi:hypothetical protein